MERIAIIADVHGNLPALESVLADIERREINEIYCLGDLAGKGPSSAAAVDRVRSVCKIVVLGNWENVLAGPNYPHHEHFNWHRQRLGKERLAFLGSLPVHHDFMLSGLNVRLLHATPNSIYQRIRPDASYQTLLSMFESGALIADGTAEPDIVVYAHTHRADLTNLHRDQKILLNVGSVGNPTDLPLASYAILEGRLASCERDSVSLQIVRVAYDIDSAVHDAQQSDLPDKEDYILELRSAVYRGEVNG